jgi:fused signal recognition particle receptor
MFGFKKQKIKEQQTHLSSLHRTQKSFSAISKFLKNDNDEKVELNDIEDLLIAADVGVTTSNKIINDLKNEPTVKKLKNILTQILLCSHKSFNVSTDKKQVVLMVGINGAGKTTTLTKLAHKFKQKNYKILIAAGDTYRAAAVLQLKKYSEKYNIDIVAHEKDNADSSAVIYDACESLIQNDYDILLADTAGRLHNNKNLIAQLQKTKRIILKKKDKIDIKIILVIDGGGGQNSLNQATEFNREIGIDGVIITKLDGTAKGGIVFAIADKLSLPIYYIGVGEKKEDLKTFVIEEFIKDII